jgi:thiol-disulfide isomerase/thioredoxin
MISVYRFSVIIRELFKDNSMAENNEQNNSSKAVWRVPLIVLTVIIVLAVLWRFLYAPAPKEVAPAPEPNKVQPLIAPPPVIRAPLTLDDVIRIRKHWDPAFMEWVGKDAPNFDVTDINGSSHKLSAYKGRTVMLIIWATWCGPCRMEIPDLIKLRKETPPEKLAMVAISYEEGDQVRQFLSQVAVNYTVIATPQSTMPAPYSMINAIPVTFFIDKMGVLRLVAEGLLLQNEVQMILKAID